MRAHQIMTRRIVTVTADTPIIEAANMMLTQHISGLPVISQAGILIGIISESDFIRRKEIGTQRKRARWLQLLAGPGKAAIDFVHEQGRKVGEIMSSNLHTIPEDATLEDIVESMEKNHVKRLPVLQGDKLVGIVTRSNILQAVADLARSSQDPTTDDDHIRDQIFLTIEKNPWQPTGLGVIVRQGIVHLKGIITDERSRQATIVAAENVAGVKKVHDHLCFVDATYGSGMYFNSPEDQKSQAERA